MSTELKQPEQSIVAPSSTLPHIKLIATGGTIAMKRSNNGAAIPALNGDDLLASVPDIARLATIDVEDFANIPSDYITPQHWLALHTRVTGALACDNTSAVIIAHGTDTLEETAFFLDLTLDTEKPVILVGAQRNASLPQSDGPENCLDAVRVAVTRSARNSGVLVVMNQKILAARDAIKIHTHDRVGFGAYENKVVGAIDRGYVHFCRASKISRLVKRKQPIAISAATLKAQALPRVDIIAMYAGAEGDLIEAAIAAGAKGIVVQALGAGNVNQSLFAAIEKAVEQGVAVVISTRVANGGVAPVYGYEGGGQTLVDCGAMMAGDLSPQKARVLLMLSLQAELEEWFEGEVKAGVKASDEGRLINHKAVKAKWLAHMAAPASAS